MVANEVNKFRQIFPIHIGVENTRIQGDFHPFDFASKSHLRRTNLCEVYSTFFLQTYFRITLYTLLLGNFLFLYCNESV
jgi:hypothetical protein